MSGQERPPPSSLLAKSTEGATYLILLQLGSRALTFLVNQILLRFLPPELLGISAQLELYSITVLFFARESLRVALQRQNDEAGVVPVEVSNTKAHRNNSQLNRQDTKIQEVVNISYVTIGLGLPLAFIFAAFYIRNANVTVLETPVIQQSVNLYILATALELLTEPCFAIAQQQLLYGVRASAETLATFTRCLFTCGTAVWASKTNVALGALPFAIGQLGYALVLNIVYLARISPSNANKSYSIFIRPIIPSSSLLFWNRFSVPRLNLALNIYAQSVFKHILTTGDALLVAAFTSLKSQGAYALASNYGGLIARMVFQPIEESSRALFGRLLPNASTNESVDGVGATPGSDCRARVDQAATYLRKVLHFYSLISVVIVTLGPSLSPLLLRLIAGSRWSESDAPSVLAAYCYYIPLLASNGILEAFVSAAATPAQIRVQSAWMVAFSATFAATGFLVLKVWDQGARGLVLANAVNMICRIVWSWQFASDYFRRYGVVFSCLEVLPNIETLFVGLGTSFLLRTMKHTFDESLSQLSGAIIVAGCFGLTM